MKYTYTWKSIGKMYLKSAIVVLIVMILYVSVYQPLPTLIGNSIFLIVSYLSFCFFVFITSYKHLKNNVLGNHEIILSETYFIWTNGKQEIKTDLNLIKKLVIKEKYIVVKFQNIRKVKLFKKDSYEGYDEFVEKIEKIAQENQAIVKK